MPTIGQRGRNGGPPRLPFSCRSSALLALRIDDFDFAPPRALTAPRPASRAPPLVCCSFPRSWRFEDRQIADLPGSMRADDLLLFNNDTKVIPARLVGRRMLLDILSNAARRQYKARPNPLQNQV